MQAALNDTNPVVYIASVMALGEIGSPAFEILAEALKTIDNVALAVAIINALGSMGDIRGVEVLQALTNDESVDPYIRESAVSALPRLDQVINYQRG